MPKHVCSFISLSVVTPLFPVSADNLLLQYSPGYTMYKAVLLPATLFRKVFKSVAHLDDHFFFFKAGSQ